MSVDDSDSINSQFSIKPTLPRFIKDEQTPRIANGSGPATPSQDYIEMMARWELPMHLMGGTLAMRAAGKQFLPQEPGESNDLYDKRLKRSILHGIFSRTIKTLAAIPFIDPIIMRDLPKELEYLDEAATDDRQSMAEMAWEVMTDALVYGVGYILPDMPAVPDADKLSLKQERELNIRPYLARIDPTKLLGWRIEEGVLTQVRIYDYETTQNDDFTETSQHIVRVITPESFTTWRRVQSINPKTRASEFKWVADTPITNSLGRVELIPVYGNKDGAQMRATPTLEELAWLNLRHYQKVSDLDNIEHVANVPFLLGTGFPESELDSLEVGSHTVISTTEIDADLKYVEHQGHAIPYAQASITALEEKAQSMGADFLMQSATGRQTAYAKSVDTGKSLSILQAIINNLSAGLSKAVRAAGDWIQVDASKASVKVGEGIDLSLDSNDMAYLRELTKDGLLSVQDLQYELQRRGKISDSTKLKTPKKTTSNLQSREEI